MSLPEIRIKRGAALRLQMQFQDDVNQPVDLTNITLTSHVRTAAGDLIAALPVVRAYLPGIATVEVADTTTWSRGRHRADIRATIDGLPVLSDTFAVIVAAPVTQ